MYDWIDAVVEYFLLPACLVIAVVLILCVPFLGYGIWVSSQSPTFSLRKDEWTCARSHTDTTTTYVMAGKVMVPVSNTTEVCDQWTRKGLGQ